MNTKKVVEHLFQRGILKICQQLVDNSILGCLDIYCSLQQLVDNSILGCLDIYCSLQQLVDNSIIGCLDIYFVF